MVTPIISIKGIVSMSQLGFQRSTLAYAIVSVLFASGFGDGGRGNNGSTSGLQAILDNLP
jgi:hypothetical protein